MTPPIRTDVSAVEVNDGKVLVVVRVPASPARPHAFRDRVLIRVGHQTKGAPIGAIEQLFRQRDAILQGTTRLERLRSQGAEFASTYRRIIIAETYDEPPVFLDTVADALLTELATAAIGGAPIVSTRTRSVHLDAEGVPLGNDYLGIDEAVSLVRYCSWLGTVDGNHGGTFAVSQTAHMAASSLALSLRLREYFNRTLLVDVRFEQRIEAGVGLADSSPWDYLLGLTGSERAPGGLPDSEESRIDLTSGPQRLDVIVAMSNLSVRACGLSAKRSALHDLASLAWSDALGKIDAAVQARAFRRARLARS